MADGVLTETATAITAAIEAKRVAGDFVTDVFTPAWDYEGREQEIGLTDTDLHVRVVVPRTFIAIDAFAREELDFKAAFDIDIKKKFTGAMTQDASQQIDKDELITLSQLTEQIHQMWCDVDEWHVTTSSDYDAMWLPPGYSGIPSRQESQILIAYSERELRENRTFFAVCREAFQVTA